MKRFILSLCLLPFFCFAGARSPMQYAITEFFNHIEAGDSAGAAEALEILREDFEEAPNPKTKIAPLFQLILQEVNTRYNLELTPDEALTIISEYLSILNAAINEAISIIREEIPPLNDTTIEETIEDDAEWEDDLIEEI